MNRQLASLLVSMALPLFMALLAGNLPADEAPCGYLWQPAYAVDNCRRPPAVPYEPQPGDIVLYNAHNLYWQFLYRLALTKPPTHSGIVVNLPDGSLALLEAGPDRTLDVHLLPLRPHLENYPGTVYVRRRKFPLTEEESARLTDFALANHLKKVPPLRFVCQVTPFRCRGPLRTAWLGKPRGIHRAYTCSELVVETCVAAGLVDAETARPAATYPRDLFFEHSSNFYLKRHFSLSCGWEPPALWTCGQ